MSQNDIKSVISCLDEWDEIEKFNALAEEHDKFQKKYDTHSNQQKMQESLKKQIQEHRKFKVFIKCNNVQQLE